MGTLGYDERNLSYLLSNETKKPNLPKIPEPPLLVKLKPSKRFKQLLVAIHGLALGSSVANALPLAVKLLLLTGIIIHLGFMLKHLNGKHYKIKHTEAFGWELSEGDDFESIQILNSTVINSYAIFLHFHKKAKRRALLILNDALTENDYRRLIVRLKTTDKK